jgi:hypothetical protein
MLWEHVSSFEDILDELKKEKDEKKVRRKACLCLEKTILCVETFLNSYVRFCIETDKKLEIHKQKILDEFKTRKPLEYKIKKWPKRLFKKDVDLSDFKKIKDYYRNPIEHWEQSWETVDANGVIFLGLDNIEIYDSLSKEKAFEFYEIMWNTILKILESSNDEDHETNLHKLHYWTGIIKW